MAIIHRQSAGTTHTDDKLRTLPMRVAAAHLPQGHSMNDENPLGCKGKLTPRFTHDQLSPCTLMMQLQRCSPLWRKVVAKCSHTVSGLG
jgi:hypothetical protein